MENKADFNLDDKLIKRLGLQLTEAPLNTQATPNARAFKYPHLEDVYIMESDLYGNIMPKGSCFLAFKGRNGLVGKHLHVETLENASLDDIKEMVSSNAEG
jgi:hypothetical protein